MKKVLLAIALVALIAPAVMAGTVTLVGDSTLSPHYDGYGYYQTGIGGEFTFKVSDALTGILNQGYVDGVTKNVQNSVGTFQSFCVEYNEHIYANGIPYDVAFGDITKNSGKTLTLGAAWLYYQFATENLTGFSYTRTAEDVQALQNAIWYFMGEGNVTADNNEFIKLANDHFGYVDNKEIAKNANNNTIGVTIMNMWQGDPRLPSSQRQDQLVLRAVPDGGLTVMLLGLGIGGLALLSRKIKA